MNSILANTKTNKAGFSVVELVVVLTIFSIMSSISIFNYNDYRKNIEKSNVSQDIALSIRQAQVYGISSSDRIIGDIDLDTTGNADELFGAAIIDITRDQSIRGVVVFPDQEKIILYEDLNRNYIYNEATDRIIDERSIVSGSIDITGSYLCTATEEGCENFQTGRVDITFQRPYPEAYISYGGDRNDTYSFGTIVISSGSGIDQYIQISSIGNILVNNSY